MTKPPIKLGLLERVVLFFAFLIMTGGVIGVIAFLSNLHRPKPVAVSPPRPATRPAVVKAEPKLTPKPLVIELPKVIAEAPAPTTMPAETVAVAPPPAPAPVEAPAPAPQVEVAEAPMPRPVGPRPYALPLISAKVIQAVGDADNEEPYRYHVKIDPAEIELLRAFLNRAARQYNYQLDEFDHVAAEPAVGDLPWWQPKRLIDVNVIALSPPSDPVAKIWTAVSAKTGDVLVYSVKPLDFSRHAEARTGD